MESGSAASCPAEARLKASAAHVVPPPPVWVLSLRRSTDRRAYVSRHLAALGIPFEIVDAVDGRALSADDIAAVYDAASAIRRIGRELTVGEIGCSLSHRALYRRMLDERVPEAIILEDDVDVAPAFLEIMGRRDGLPRDWELILFCHSGALTSAWRRRRCHPDHEVVKFASVAYSTAGYLLNERAARKLLAHASPVCLPADQLTGGGVRCGLRVYGIDPPCMDHLSHTPTMSSTMPEAEQVRKKWPTKSELGRLRWIGHRAKFAMLDRYRRYGPWNIR